MNIDREQLRALGWPDDLIEEVLRQGKVLDQQIPVLEGSGYGEGLQRESVAGSKVELTPGSLTWSSATITLHAPLEE